MIKQPKLTDPRDHNDTGAPKALFLSNGLSADRLATLQIISAHLLNELVTGKKKKDALPPSEFVDWFF